MIPEDIKRAQLWRKNHSDHVAKLLAEEPMDYFEPCNEDRRHPELWKAGSWRYLEVLEALGKP